MTHLLDTHTFIWAITDTRRLPGRTRAALEDPNNTCYVSAVSLWEMAIKIRNGRLEPVGRWQDPISIVKAQGFETIPLLPEEAATSKQLTEDTHFDPFDRMLIWQAIQRDLILVSSDRQFEHFKNDGLRLIWK